MSTAIKASEHFSIEFKDRVLPAFFASKLSARTKKEYYRNVIHLCNFFHKDFLEITKEDAQNYFDNIREGNKSANDKTIRFLKASFLAMEKHAKGTEWNAETSVFKDIEHNKTEDHINADKIPTSEEVSKILDAAREDTRDYIILLVIYRMALGSTQIATLKKEQLRVDGNGNLYIVFSKKNNVEHYMAVPNDIKEELIKYNNSVETEYLFANKKGKPLNRKTIYRITSKYRVKAGIDTKCSTKDMRNRALLEQLQAGATKEEVATYSGISQKRVITLEQNVPKLRICPPERVTIAN